MENFKDSKPDLLSSGGLEVDEQSGNHLKDAGQWAKTVAIIVSVLGGLITLIVLAFGSAFSNSIFFGLQNYASVLIVILIIVVGIALIGIINLLRFGSGMSSGINNQDATAFDKGMGGLKNYFILIGVLDNVVCFDSRIATIKINIYMETNYTPGNDQLPGDLLGISIEGETRSKLETITTWSKITAIGGFVNMVLSLINTFNTFSNISKGIGATWLIVTTLVQLVVSFFLNFFLWQFSKHLKFSIDNENQESFVAAAMQLKAYMRMLGILLIVSIVLGIIGSLSLGRSIGRY